MSTATLLLVAALALPVQDRTEANPADPAQAASTAATPAFDVPNGTVRPAEFVAARVRDVLRNAADQTAWQSLAEALPDMAISGDADLMSTFEAAAIAEGMVGQTPTTPVNTAEADLIDWKSTSTFQVAALTLLLCGLGVFGFRHWKERRTARTSRSYRVRRPTRSAQPAAAPVPAFGTPGAARLAHARQLASGDLDISEIARQTGMARDAIAVLIGMQQR